MPARHNEWDMVSESQAKASAKYQKEYITQVNIKLNVRTDKDIISFLWGVPNVQGLIKQLLRDEISRRDADKNTTSLPTD